MQKTIKTNPIGVRNLDQLLCFITKPTLSQTVHHWWMKVTVFNS